MSQLSTGHVFISYSRKDNAIMRRIVSNLRQQGIKVWVDNEELIPGTPVWEREIEAAIGNAFAIIVILSPDSKNSEWVRREITLTEQHRKRIFPVLVEGDEGSSISLRLITHQFVDLRHNEKAGLNALSAAIQSYLSQPSSTGNHIEVSNFTYDIQHKSVVNKPGFAWQSPLGILVLIGLVSVCAISLTAIRASLASQVTAGPTPSFTSPPTQRLIISTSTNAPTPTKPKPTAVSTSTLIPSPSPTEIVPKAYGFQACESACNGQNFAVMFPGGIKRIYVQFNYENIPPGSSYIRTWDLEGQEWIRYTCKWDGPLSGTEIVKFTEPDGLHSGVWTMTVRVNDKIILQEQLTIAGNWTYWFPAGTRNICHNTN